MRVNYVNYLPKRLILTADEKIEENVVMYIGQVGWECQRG